MPSLLRNSRVSALVAGFIGLYGTGVSAQPGDHIRTGDLTFAPGFDLGGEYHSNVFLMDGIDADVIPGFYVTPQPHFGLDVQGSKLALNLNGDYKPRLFLTPDLARASSLKDHDLGLGLDLLPKSTLGVTLNNAWSYASRLTEIESAFAISDQAVEQGIGIADPHMVRISDEMDGGLGIHPGSALRVDLLGSYGWERWNAPPELNALSESHLNDGSGVGGKLNAQWKFFPSTALVLRSEYRHWSWERNVYSIESRDAEGNPQADEEYGRYIAVPDGDLWRVSGGLMGRITERLGANLLLGYGQVLNDEQSVIDYAGANGMDISGLSGYGDDLTGLDGLLALFNLRYDLAPEQRLVVGFNRSFRSTYYTNAVQFNAVFAQYRGVLRDHFLVNGIAGFRVEDLVGTIHRIDDVVRVKAELGYRTNRGLELAAEGGWDRRASAGPQELRDPYIEYDDFWGGLYLRFTY